MKKLYLLVALCWFCYPALAQSLIYSDTIPKVDIRISPDHAMGGTVADRIEDLTFIPLRGDVIPFVSDFAIQHGQIALVSRGAKLRDKFLLFDLEGKQLYQSTDESLGFTSTERTITDIGMWDDKHLVATMRNTIHLDPAKLASVSKDAQTTGKADDSVKLRSTTWYYDSPRYLHERISKSALSKGDKILVKYGRDSMGPMHDLQQNFSNVFFEGGEPRAYATFSYHYKLFELGESGVAKIFNVVLPMKHTIDTAAIFNFTTQQEYDQYFDSDPVLIKGFNSVIRYRDYILFNLLGTRLEWLAYHTETGELMNLRNILPDKTNDFISFVGSELKTDGDFLYSYIYPNQIRNTMEKSREEGHLMRPEYQAMAKHDNPILVRFKLK